MRPALPDVKVLWFKALERKSEVLIISEPTCWVSHWDPNVNRGRRCGGMQCYSCAVGAQRQMRAVVLVVDSRGKEHLLELRERHREQLDSWESTVGLRISIKKEGGARNSPVSIVALGFEAAVERDITRLVAVLGLPAVMVRADVHDQARVGAEDPDREDRTAGEGSTSEVEHEWVGPRR